jgi:hypothetical protein
MGEDENPGQIVRRSWLMVVVVVCHVLVILVYLGGGIITDYVRRTYAHGIPALTAWFLEVWFSYLTLHRAVMEGIMLLRRGK